MQRKVFVFAILYCIVEDRIFVLVKKHKEGVYQFMGGEFEEGDDSLTKTLSGRIENEGLGRIEKRLKCISTFMGTKGDSIHEEYFYSCQVDPHNISSNELVLRPTEHLLKNPQLMLPEHYLALRNAMAKLGKLI